MEALLPNGVELALPAENAEEETAVEDAGEMERIAA
jgi:hypothetical protein